MKKTILFICVAVLLISSCSMFENFGPADPTPVPPTPEPTATPDPCASENLLAEVEKVQDLVNAFQDIAYLANFTPQTELVNPILEMQKVRRDLQKFKVPACEDAIKTATLNYMNSTISYLAYFMGGESKENVDAGIQNSQVLWEVVLGEFSKLLTSAGLVSDALPDVDGTIPPTSGSGIYVSNEETQGINVRSLPELNANIIGSLEPAKQAIALSKNEAGDWILVNMDEVIGWVFAEAVVLSGPIEDLPVSNPVE